MKRVGVIGDVDGWSSQRLAAALERRTGFSCLIDLGRVNLDLHRGRLAYDAVDLLSLDGLVVKKISSEYSSHDMDRLEMLRYAEQSGVPVFSKPQNIMRLLDRLACTITLRLHGAPMPPTVITEDLDQAVAAVAAFECAVLKPLFSTKARGMQVVEAGPDSREKLECFRQAGNRLFYIQKMLRLPGHDLGVVFLGGDYLATYARIGDKEAWNTTTHFGGRYEPATPSDEVIEVARRAQAPFGLDFTCVDVAETDDGLIVFEVSAFGGFRGLQVAHDIDAAELVADYVLRKIEDA